jgi:hypothetical protein
MVTKQALEARLAELNREFERAQAQANAIAGARQVIEQLIAECDTPAPTVEP